MRVWLQPSRIPRGHELIGVVEEIGSEITNIKPGDLVIAPFAFQDSTCIFCQEGIHTSCIHGGAYSAVVKVPGANPDTAEESLLASLLTLSDMYLTGYHAAFMTDCHSYR